jgi:iron complex outermembrane receptor protein
MANEYRYFDLKLNPRFIAVYELKKDKILRFAFQKGYRFPSIFEGYSNINSGGVKRVGGLKVMSDGVFEKSWLKSSIDTFVAKVNRDVNTSGITQTAAIDKNKTILKTNEYTYLKPEEVLSFELGYRGIFAGNRLFIDADIYYNHYTQFIAQIEASIPNTSDSAQMPAYLFDRNKQSRYRLWTNSKTAVHNYGAELELRYNINRHYYISANGCYQELKNTDKNDGLEDGFNTPRWMANAGFNGNGILKGLGFGLNARIQSRYYWESFSERAFGGFNLDAMVRYVFKPSAK